MMNAVALRAVPKVIAPVPAYLAPRTFTLLDEGELSLLGARKSVLRKSEIEFSYASIGILPARVTNVPDVVGRQLRLTENAPLWRVWEQLREDVVSGIPLSITHLEAVAKGKTTWGNPHALSGKHDLVVFVSGADGPVAVLLTYVGFWKGSVYRDVRTAHRTLARDTRLILPA